MINYPERLKEMTAGMGKLGKVIPGTVQAVGAMHQASFKPGALDSKTKHLIALGIGISARCDGCIASHVFDALREGASREEIAETVSVAILMGGGPSMVSGIEAMGAVDQFQEKA